jgi:hypothetical protein
MFTISWFYLQDCVQKSAELIASGRDDIKAGCAKLAAGGAAFLVFSAGPTDPKVGVRCLSQMHFL